MDIFLITVIIIDIILCIEISFYEIGRTLHSLHKFDSQIVSKKMESKGSVCLKCYTISGARFRLKLVLNM